MSTQHLHDSTARLPGSLEARLAAYLASAGGAATMLSSGAAAAIVAHTTPQPIGINQEVNIDFNQDGQTDFQIDHDRFNLNGTNLDYLQIDKNDVNGVTNPLAFDTFENLQAQTFPPGATTPNNQTDAAYLTTSLGSYPSALEAGAPVGPGAIFDFQEGDNFNGTTKWIRANRLIDEDATQIDQVLGGQTPDGVYLPTDGPNFVGLNGEIRYLGVRLHLNGAPNTDPRYGWIGVQITNEADATGVITGWAYESTVNTPIAAGDTGPFVANADYDDDGDVDGTDFLVWQRAAGTTVVNGTGADGNGDGTVSAADLSLWQNQYGAGATVADGISGTPVPEPGSLLMGSLGLALLISWVVVKRGCRKLIPIRCRQGG